MVAQRGFGVRCGSGVDQFQRQDSGGFVDDDVNAAGVADIDPTALAAVFHNSVTFAFAEITGRSYGGGILELEPAEAEQLPIPAPAHAGAELACDVDLLLKANEIQKALDVVDRHVLIDGLGLSGDVVAQCRAAWVLLRDRRTRRGSR